MAWCRVIPVLGLGVSVRLLLRAVMSSTLHCALNKLRLARVSAVERLGMFVPFNLLHSDQHSYGLWSWVNTAAERLQ
jgi:hypothetical protein